MNIETLDGVQKELTEQIVGNPFGRVFQLSPVEIAIDVHLNDGRWLFISVEPSDPRVYLVRRRLRELEKQSNNPSPFLLALRKHLSGETIRSIETIENERVLLFRFSAKSDPNKSSELSLSLQLTGRSSNLFLLDGEDGILAMLRAAKGRSIGDRYAPPVRIDPDSRNPSPEPKEIQTASSGSISEQLDREDLGRRSEQEFDNLSKAARSTITSAIKRKKKLRSNLENDLKDHGDAAHWKRFGDILLANTATAEKRSGVFIAIDHFDEGLPKVEIPFENDESVTETAEKYFRRYTKARNAALEISRRLAETNAELDQLHIRLMEIESMIADRNIDGLKGVLAPSGSKKNVSKGRGQSEPSKAYRTFVSSDGFEILVGKKAKDNDFLTLRIAKSLDVWMHAADYPGSHVVIRDSGKREVPPQTLLEAAELAAFYSQGRKQVKAAVHCTQKKFVNKPKGSAPGLVSLASFKTLLVEPKIPAGISRQ